MELWIRSQDGEVLGKAEEIMIYQKEKQCEIIINNYTYGTYATKERALEVLDEIQNILKPQLLIRRNDDNDKVLLGALQKGVTQKIDMEYKELSTYVYEMPKE